MLGYVATNKRGNERTKLETSAEKKNTGKRCGALGAGKGMQWAFQEQKWKRKEKAKGNKHSR